MILAVVGLLAVVDFPSIEGRGPEIVVFLAGTLSDFDRFDPIIFCIAGAGLLSLLGGIGQDLLINRFAEAGKVEGHGVVAIVWLDIMGRVANAVVGIRVADTLDSTRDFQLPSPCIAPCLFGESCFSSLFSHWYHFWRPVPFGMMVYWAFQSRWGWGKGGSYLIL